MTGNVQDARLGLIARLTAKAPNGHLGRTSLMKYCYFLQVLRGVPLGYTFTLYSYGPFDSDVLADLDFAEAVGAVTSQQVIFSGGYGYQIKSGPTANLVEKRSNEFVKKYNADIDWVVKTFGTLTSAELELTSTIVYVDRESAHARQSISIDDLAARVHEIKPHHSIERIKQHATDLLGSGVLKAVKKR